MESSSQAGLTWLAGQTRALFVLTALVASTGCANRPWVQSSTPVAAQDESVVVTDPRATIIIVQPGDEAAPAPEVVVQRSLPKNDGWAPTAFPATNPFEKYRTWVGDYDCTQGNTGFALRIMDVRGRVVRAIFDFTHAPSGATGTYVVTGTFDSDTRRVHFDPSRWIEQPDDYIMVPMSGEISADDTLFAGKIDFPGCGAFTLKPAR